MGMPETISITTVSTEVLLGAIVLLLFLILAQMRSKWRGPPTVQDQLKRRVLENLKLAQVPPAEVEESLKLNFDRDFLEMYIVSEHLVLAQLDELTEKLIRIAKDADSEEKTRKELRGLVGRFLLGAQGGGHKITHILLKKLNEVVTHALGGFISEGGHHG
jgi:hypothetical protein